jgi:hypothetical protein
VRSVCLANWGVWTIFKNKMFYFFQQIKIAVGEEIASRKRVHKVAKRDLTEEEETSTKTEEEER